MDKCLEILAQTFIALKDKELIETRTMNNMHIDIYELNKNSEISKIGVMLLEGYENTKNDIAKYSKFIKKENLSEQIDEMFKRLKQGTMVLYDQGFFTLDDYFKAIKYNKINLSDIEDELQLETYIKAIYTTMMEYIGLDNNSIQSYIEDFLDDDMVNVEGKTNEQILEEIRDDILNEFKKDFNYLCFENRDRS